MSLEDFPNFSILFFFSVFSNLEGGGEKVGPGEGRGHTRSQQSGLRWMGDGIQSFSLTGKLDFILYSL